MWDTRGCRVDSTVEPPSDTPEGDIPGPGEPDRAETPGGEEVSDPTKGPGPDGPEGPETGIDVPTGVEDIGGPEPGEGLEGGGESTGGGEGTIGIISCNEACRQTYSDRSLTQVSGECSTTVPQQECRLGQGACTLNGLKSGIIQYLAEPRGDLACAGTSNNCYCRVLTGCCSSNECDGNQCKAEGGYCDVVPSQGFTPKRGYPRVCDDPFSNVETCFRNTQPLSLVKDQCCCPSEERSGYTYYTWQHIRAISSV